MNNSVNFSFYIFLVIYISAVTIEIFYNLSNKLNLYNIKDCLVNVFFGFSAVISRTLTKGVWIAIWTFLYQYSAIKLPETVTTYLILFFINEFVYYWFHRLSHEKRLLWAIHVNHHSSEFFNFTTAARAPFFNLILHNVFWIPLLFLGFSPTMIFSVETIGFLFSFIQHTQIIKNFGIFDSILNSPSHHRVHHSSNPEYINKNYGNVLILFDRLFGTFQAELKEVKIKYGLPKNIKSYNPLIIVFHEWIEIFKQKNKNSL
ncbi:MAG TPA: sterol desaturase family protein [Flavobacterium sp.]|nr:sterol desaturase family protein [Flavobacterium sp.]